MLSQSRHENLSRTCWMTFHWRGIDLQRLGYILAELGQARSAAAGATGRRWDDHPLARQMLGKRFARGTLAGEGGDIRRSGLPRRALGGEIVLAGRRLQFLELQLHLVEKPRRAFRTRPEQLPPHLLDLELQMRDQRLIGGELRPARRRRPPRPEPAARARRRARLSALSISFGKVGEGRRPCPEQKHKIGDLWRPYFADDSKCRGLTRLREAYASSGDCASRSRREDSRVAPP